MAAQSLRLAGQVRDSPVDLRRDRSPSRARGAGQHPGGRRSGRGEGSRGSGALARSTRESCERRENLPATFASSTFRPNRVWTRDSGPIFVRRDSRKEGRFPAVAATAWRFNAWAKYNDWKLDATDLEEKSPSACAFRRGNRR